MSKEVLEYQLSKKAKFHRRLIVARYHTECYPLINLTMNHTTSSKENVAVVGLDSVGVPLAIWATRRGYNVIGIDPNMERVERLKRQVEPFADEQLARSYNLYPFDISTCEQNVVHADIVVISAPPQFPDEEATAAHNHDKVEQLSNIIAPYVQEDQLIIIQSVLNGGVSIKKIRSILERESGLRAGTDFYLTHFPQDVPSNVLSRDKNKKVRARQNSIE